MKNWIFLNLLGAMSANAAVELSNPAAVPTNHVAVSQLDSSGTAPIQARNRLSDLSDWRAITETFQWIVTNAFDGIGLYMDGGNNSYWSTTSTQTYQFVIQTLDSNVPTQTVLNATFSLTGDKVADGQWLYIDTDNVALQNGQWYGFSLCPAQTDVNGVLRTFWDTAASDAYAGLARQYAPNSTSGIPKTDSYSVGGGPQGDYTFYLLHEPPPPSVIRIVDWSFVSEDLVEMVVDIPGNPALYHPEITTNLALGPWISVEHSVDGANPFVTTNLGYSAVGTNGTDRIIYLKAEGQSAFFNVAAGAFPPPSSWIFMGNEKEEVVDVETGRTVVYLTAGNSLDTHFHYQGGSWGTINGATYLFFSSSRSRPPAAGAPNSSERQLMAANVQTGDLYYLTSIPDPHTRVGKIYYHRPYQSTYNDALKTLFYWGLKPRQKLYAYNCKTGVEKLLLTLPVNHDARLADDYADTNSVRLIFGVSNRDDDTEYIEVADFDLNLDPLSNTVVRTAAAGDDFDHVALCPTNKEIFFYKHHPAPVTDQAYLKLVDLAQGSETVINPGMNPYVDHMVWSKSGDAIYWDDNAGNLWRFNLAAQTKAIVGSETPIHNQLSSDEQLWVFDYRDETNPYWTDDFENPLDNDPPTTTHLENWHGSIRIHDMQSNTSEKYANIIWGSPHPRHPHAIFSPDDSMISFVTGVDSENSRVAIMHVVE